MMRQEHRRVMRRSGNHGQGGCCLRLGTDSHQKAVVRKQAGPARHRQSSHGDQGCPQGDAQLQRASPRTRGSRASRPPQPAFLLHEAPSGLRPLWEKTRGAGPRGFLAITDPGCLILPHLCLLLVVPCWVAAPASSLPALDLVVTSLGLAPGNCASVGPGAPVLGLVFSS